jgi:hypothetical protein
MGHTFKTISKDLRHWVGEQRVFFVGTAPLAGDGHVNCSPKGGDTLRIMGERELAYLDLTGSGVETIAHLQENGRIVVMLCAFSGAPRIVRFHGKGEVIYPKDGRFQLLRTHFAAVPGVRSIIHVVVDRISDSCGMSVPYFDYVGHRPQLDDWAKRKGEAGLEEYRREKNQKSIDGLPGHNFA